jgi:RNA recognition motif-containing protein
MRAKRWSLNSEKLLAEFSPANRGFGFVDMPNDKDGMDAIRKHTNAEFFGRKLVG